MHDVCLLSIGGLGGMGMTASKIIDLQDFERTVNTFSNTEIPQYRRITIPARKSAHRRFRMSPAAPTEKRDSICTESYHLNADSELVERGTRYTIKPKMI